jgi:hypothetical protein
MSVYRVDYLNGKFFIFFKRIPKTYRFLVEEAKATKNLDARIKNSLNCADVKVVAFAPTPIVCQMTTYDLV